MNLIDPDGLFGGDRIAQLSDRAKLYWPWLYLAANGYGRLELNMRKLRCQVFSSFSHPPSDEDMIQMLGEYQDRFLLFVYEHKGQLWGQFWTSEKHLPYYKTAADKRSPVPPSREYLEWKNRYGVNKTEQVSLRRLPQASEHFPHVEVVEAEAVSAVVKAHVIQIDASTNDFNAATACEELQELYPKKEKLDAGVQWHISELGHAEDPVRHQQIVMAGLRKYMRSKAWRDPVTGELTLQFIPTLPKFLGCPLKQGEIPSRMYLDDPEEWHSPNGNGNGSQRRSAAMDTVDEARSIMKARRKTTSGNKR